MPYYPVIRDIADRGGGVPMKAMEHLAGWILIVYGAGSVLAALSRLVTARLRAKRFTAVPAALWAGLFLSPVLLLPGSTLVGREAPLWLGWPVLLFCVAGWVLLALPGIGSRRKAGLPWWRFWTAVPAPAPDPADPGDRAGSPVFVRDAEALIERISTARFSTTRRGPGYDEQEVDTFLDKLIAGLNEGGRLDPAEVRGIMFTTTRLRPGYSQQDVDDFLDEITAQAASLGT
jgi:DivIVA domain-containing protein